MDPLKKPRGLFAFTTGRGPFVNKIVVEDVGEFLMTTGSRNGGDPLIAEAHEHEAPCQIVVQFLGKMRRSTWFFTCQSEVQAETMHKTMATIGRISITSLNSLGFIQH